jgi:hypothetical protein
MPENFVRKVGPVAPEIPDFNSNDLADEGANDPYFDPRSYVIENEVVADEAMNKPLLTRGDFLPESIAKARVLSGKGYLNNEDPIFPQLTDDTVTETIVVDDVLKPTPVVIESKYPPLTREDFSEQAIIAKKLALLAEADTTTKSISKFPQFKEADIQKIDMTEALNKPVLSRYDFTPQGIAEARKKAQGINPESRNKLPDHLKIEASLRANDNVSSDQGFAPTIPNYNQETSRSNAHNTAVPKSLYKIKPEPKPVKKSFFSRLVPKFISRFF